MLYVVDGELGEEQIGLRPTRSCAEQTFILRRIIKKCQEYQLPLAISFIDIAFDSIHMENLNTVCNPTEDVISSPEDL